MRIKEGELGEVARRLLDRVRAVDTDGARVLALTGDLGAGKTALTRAIAAELGVRDEVTSPTFVIEQIYDLYQDRDWSRLIHIDAYRLETSEELTPLGFAEQAGDPENLIVIEWAKRVENSIPVSAVWVELKVTGEDERNVRILNTES